MSKLVIFDFDGTLADTAPDMIIALNSWLRFRKRPQVQLEEMKNICSGGSRALLSACGVRDENWDDAINDYLHRYEQTAYQQTKLFSGIESLLSNFSSQNHFWAIATNKPRRYFEPIAKQLQLSRKGMLASICGDEVSHPKPNASMLLELIKNCAAHSKDCFYVGDDWRDAKSAQNAGIDFIGVLWGYWQQDQWKKESLLPIHSIVSTPSSLQTVLEE